MVKMTKGPREKSLETNLCGSKAAVPCLGELFTTTLTAETGIWGMCPT